MGKGKPNPFIIYYYYYHTFIYLFINKMRKLINGFKYIWDELFYTGLRRRLEGIAAKESFYSPKSSFQRDTNKVYKKKKKKKNEIINFKKVNFFFQKFRFSYAQIFMN